MREERDGPALSSAQIRQSLDNVFNLRHCPVGLKISGAGPEVVLVWEFTCMLAAAPLASGAPPGLWNTFYLTLTKMGKVPPLYWYQNWGSERLSE